MADYVSILSKAISGLSENTAERREQVYAKARLAIDRKLRSMDPVPSEAVIAKQLASLEAAINEIESNHAAAEIEAELDLTDLAGQAPDVLAAPEPASPEAGASPAEPPAAPVAAAAAAPAAHGMQPDTATADEIRPEAPYEATEPAQAQDARADEAIVESPQGVPASAPATADTARMAAPEFVEPVSAGVGVKGPVPAAPSRQAEPSFSEIEAPVSVTRLDDKEPGFAPDRDPWLDRSEAAELSPRRRSNAGRIVGWTAILAILAGGAWAGWTFREPLKQVADQTMLAASELLGLGAEAPSGDTATPPPDAGATAEPDAATQEPADKDTSRVGGGESAPADGQAADQPEVPAAEQPVAITPEPVAPADTTPAADTVEPSPTVTEVPGQNDTVEPVEDANADTPAAAESGQDAGSAATQSPQIAGAGQKAFLYEEGGGSSGANRSEAVVNWTLTQEPPEDGLEPEAAIRGFMEVPGRGLTMQISIKRNIDEALPASHIIELNFTALPEFSGGDVDNVARFVMKASEQARGESLIAVPARIDAGYFLIALNNLPQALETNERLLLGSDWIDIVVSYTTGRRALVTLEKGSTGSEVFRQAFEDWKNR